MILNTLLNFRLLAKPNVAGKIYEGVLSNMERLKVYLNTFLCFYESCT